MIHIIHVNDCCSTHSKRDFAKPERNANKKHPGQDAQGAVDAPAGGGRALLLLHFLLLYLLPSTAFIFSFQPLHAGSTSHQDW